MKREYRITVAEAPDGSGKVKIEMEVLFMWLTIWESRYERGDRDYARQCAEELVECLMEEI